MLSIYLITVLIAFIVIGLAFEVTGGDTPWPLVLMGSFAWPVILLSAIITFVGKTLRELIK